MSWGGYPPPRFSTPPEWPDAAFPVLPDGRRLRETRITSSFRRLSV
jgi:hypothetical protein